MARVEDASACLILVADDEPAIRTLLRTALERRGHRVLEAGSAAEVFKTLDTQRPDILLLDLHLGPDDGLAIGAGLRQETEYSSMRIVFMSGTMSKQEAIRQSQLWNVPILGKPFDFDALFAEIDA